MMKKLLVKNFKAIEGELVVALNNMNLLVYGENGSGKSSLLEVIKVIFFSDRLKIKIPSASTPEEQKQKNKEFWNQYNNKKSKKEFELYINESEYRDFDISPFQVFLFSPSTSVPVHELNLKRLLNHFYIKISDIDKFCLDNYEFIETEVNSALQIFSPEIRVEISREDDYSIIIRDEIRLLERKNNLGTYFNEAKLNFIYILIFFHTVRYCAKCDKKKIIVLDDFITSLDVANRTFLIKQVFEHFTEFQILIFTHSASFHNLIAYMINDFSKNSKDWIVGNLYEHENKTKYYVKNQIKSVSEISEFFSSSPDKIEQTGNIIRQKFEVLLYEISKLLMLGAVEESNKILERLLSGKNIYYKDKKTAIDLVDEIYRNINNGVEHNLKGRINTKIEDFRYGDLSNFKNVLIEMKLYRKLTLHPMSHGKIGKTQFTIKEIKSSIELLKKIEDFIKDLTDKDISSL